MARASWNMNYEKILVDILHEHNHVKYQGQNGWALEGWRSMTQIFNEKCPLAKFTKAQIQEKEKELKTNYKALKEARKQSDVGWNEGHGYDHCGTTNMDKYNCRKFLTNHYYFI
jgi:hypothetical protein